MQFTKSFARKNPQYMKRVWHSQKSALAFGVVLPLLAAVLDPYVFKGDGIFSGWAGADYALIAFGTASMSYWLIMQNSSAFLSGVFGACGFLAGVIGIILFVPSLLGMLVMGVGIMGFIPFGTAYVFIRAANQIWKTGLAGNYKPLHCASGFFLVFAILILSQHTTSLMLERAAAVCCGRNGEMDAYEKLLLLAAEPFGLKKNLVQAWMQEQDEARALQIASFYRQHYGSDILHNEVLFFD